MKNIKMIIAILFFNLMGLMTVSSQSADYTTNTSESTVSNDTDGKKPVNITGWIVGGVAVAALAIVTVMMVRNRKSTIGGIQSQDKPAPDVKTTDSINNPASGV